jgi:hypothetical protein
VAQTVGVAKYTPKVIDAMVNESTVCLSLSSPVYRLIRS